MAEVKNTNNKNSNTQKRKSFATNKTPKDSNGNYYPISPTHKTHLEYKTHNGHKLTPKEAKFIDLYIETGNQRQSVIDAGYTSKAPGQYAQRLLEKNYIVEEIDHRLQKLEDEKIASAEEILKYFTGVMRGEIKDQFGLDTPLSERTKAAQELAKRKIDIVNKINGAKEENSVVTIKLDWSGMVDSDDGEKEDDGNEDE